MGKIEVRLRSGYPNQFVTTMAGAIIKKEEWSLVDEEDYEVRHFLETDTVIEVRGKEDMEKKIILTDTVSTSDSLKEVVGPTVSKQNEKVLKEMKDESPEGDDQEE